MFKKFFLYTIAILLNISNVHALSDNYQQVKIGLFFNTKTKQVDENYNTLQVNSTDLYTVTKYLNDIPIESFSCTNESISIQKTNFSNKIIVFKNDNTFISASNNEYIEILPKNNLFTINNTASYRGSLILRNTSDNKFILINKLSIEEYLYGVVVKEIGSKAPIEAIKAQAIAARTYTLTHMGMYNMYGFDMTDDSSNQVYGNYNAENEKVNSAVDATRGLVMFYEDKPIQAFYFSSSGGRTESCENVWTKKIPYLTSVSDEYELNRGPRNWSICLTCDKISQILKSRGIEIGELLDIIVTKRAPSNRVLELQIIGSTSTKTYTKNNVRNPFNLKSQLFWVYKDNDTYHFYGKGYGHAVGLSQIGAMAMADAGFNCFEILKHYFTGINIKNY